MCQAAFITVPILSIWIIPDNDEYIIAENDKVDVDEIALSDLILSVPTKLLCRDDCVGLCPVCGCDRNESECNCQNK